MKYVIFADKEDINETIRIFDEITSHATVRNEVLAGCPDLHVVSAGFLVRDDNGKMFCWSGSTSLNMKSDGDQSDKDLELINQFFNFRS